MRIIETGVHVDVLLADIVMPRMHGLTLTRRIRQQWPELPVVLATGLPSGVNLALDCGATALIKQLHAVLTELLVKDASTIGKMSPSASSATRRS